LEKPKLLCDENVAIEVTAGLRRAGYDATHVSILGRRRDPDESQLRLAIEENRAILTHDRLDFEALHLHYMDHGWEHCDIIISQSYDVRTLVRKLLILLDGKPETMSNGIWYV
jgi:predicted nuclease of predicted toxin-antitoxin system